MDIEYGINDLNNTSLWRLIQERINSDNLKWEDGIVGDDAKGNRLIQNETSRKSKIAWLHDKYLGKKLFNSVNSYNKQQWNYDLIGCDDLQYGIYFDGGHYNWHRDIENNPLKIDDKILCRKLSMTIWLSDPHEYEGGELDIEVKGPVDERGNVRHVRYNTLKYPKGSILIFPSDKWHRVRPVTSGIRKSLVTWFRGPRFR